MHLVYRLEGVVKTRTAAGQRFRLEVEALRVEAGMVLVLEGPSGCGKSTLLDLLALTLRPDTAERFELHGGGRTVDVAALWRRGDHAALARLRAATLGYVLQTGGLLPFLSVAENIELPRRLNGLPRDDSVARLAARLDVADQLGKRPAELSVGQRQRVAIARALAHRPPVVLGDEITASVDPVTAEAIMALMAGAVTGLGTTLVLASHDPARVAGFTHATLRPRLTRRAGTTVACVGGEETAP